MTFLIWLLKLIGLKSWAIGLEAKLKADQQEQVEAQAEVNQEVEEIDDEVKRKHDEVANLPDSDLDDAIDARVRHTQDHNDSLS